MSNNILARFISYHLLLSSLSSNDEPNTSVFEIAAKIWLFSSEHAFFGGNIEQNNAVFCHFPYSYVE